jgi:ubiquinone/menaquinone biosynthesis C-methylase UbiE
MARNRNATLKFEWSDADAFPFPDERFDAVVCNYGICHFPDPDAAVREACRVLKPAVRVAFTVWSTPETAIGFGAIYGAVQTHGSLDVGLPTGPNFFLFSDPEQCRRVLTDAGFRGPAVSAINQI